MLYDTTAKSTFVLVLMLGWCQFLGLQHVVRSKYSCST